MTDTTLDEFRIEATTFLDANAAPKPPATEFAWGQGDDDVALFEEFTPAEEARLLTAATTDTIARTACTTLKGTGWSASKIIGPRMAQ